MTIEPNSEPLAQQLLTQAQTISRLRHDLDDLANETAQTSADLLARLEEFESAPAISGTPNAWCWRDLGPQARDELWHQLMDWVGWLRQRYPLAKKIPPCWAAHPEIVEELTALWLAWQQAYVDRDAPLTGAADWHDRWLPGVLHRLQHGPFALQCDNVHRERPASAYDDAPPDDAEDDLVPVSVGAGSERTRPW